MDDEPTSGATEPRRDWRAGQGSAESAGLSIRRFGDEVAAADVG